MTRLLALTWIEEMVRFGHKPGAAAVVFDLGNDPPAEPIPAELRSFL